MARDDRPTSRPPRRLSLEAEYAAASAEVDRGTQALQEQINALRLEVARLATEVRRLQDRE